MVGKLTGLQDDSLASDERPVDPARKASRKKAVNGTAYRIFKLLQWLMEAPMSVAHLNERFYKDPMIQKRLSSDSIWLYINTLKALGCRIRRPSPKTDFCYQLIDHPFGLVLGVPDVDILLKAKAYAQQHMTHRQMLLLDRLFKKLLARSTDEQFAPWSEKAIEQLFEDSRSLDYAGYQDLIDDLEGWINRGQLLKLQYRRPGVEPMEPSGFYFLPEALRYEQGVMYLHGDRPEYEDPSMLRVDRILHAEPADNAEVAEALRARRQKLEAVVMHLFVDAGDNVAALDLKSWGGTLETLEHRGTHCRLVILTRDFFRLRQQLLASGVSFQILAPQTFRQEMESVLQAMLTGYETDDDANLRMEGMPDA